VVITKLSSFWLNWLQQFVDETPYHYIYPEPPINLSGSNLDRVLVTLLEKYHETADSMVATLVLRLINDLLSVEFPAKYVSSRLLFTTESFLSNLVQTLSLTSKSITSRGDDKLIEYGLNIIENVLKIGPAVQTCLGAVGACEVILDIASKDFRALDAFIALLENRAGFICQSNYVRMNALGEKFKAFQLLIENESSVAAISTQFMKVAKHCDNICSLQPNTYIHVEQTRRALQNALQLKKRCSLASEVSQLMDKGAKYDCNSSYENSSITTLMAYKLLLDALLVISANDDGIYIVKDDNRLSSMIEQRVEKRKSLISAGVPPLYEPPLPSWSRMHKYMKNHIFRLRVATCCASLLQTEVNRGNAEKSGEVALAFFMKNLEKQMTEKELRRADDEAAYPSTDDVSKSYSFCFEDDVKRLETDIFIERVGIVCLILDEWFYINRYGRCPPSTTTDRKKQLDRLVILSNSDKIMKFMKKLGLSWWDLDDYCDVRFSKQSKAILKRLVDKNRKILATATTKKSRAIAATA
jgi:hypothetical protein